MLYESPFFRHLSTKQQPLQSAGSLSSHTRPVECLAGQVLPDGNVELCTGDTMGIIRLWTLTYDDGRWTSSLKTEFNHHRTKISDLHFGFGQLWTGEKYFSMFSFVLIKFCLASADETVQVRNLVDAPGKRTPPPITHSKDVRCLLPLYLTDLREPYIITGSGDFLRVYDVSTVEEPELLNQVESHWHDVTHIRLWMRQSTDENNQKKVEPWIVSTSLDATVRRWRLSGTSFSLRWFKDSKFRVELLVPQPKPKVAVTPAPPQAEAESRFVMTLEEEQELDELLDSD